LLGNSVTVQSRSYQWIAVVPSPQSIAAPIRARADSSKPLVLGVALVGLCIGLAAGVMVPNHPELPDPRLLARHGQSFTILARYVDAQSIEEIAAAVCLQFDPCSASLFDEATGDLVAYAVERIGGTAMTIAWDCKRFPDATDCIRLDSQGRPLAPWG
jgi:hypothetical protein